MKKAAFQPAIHKRRGERPAGFILLEAMIATAIFGMAVLALARSIEAGLQAGVVQREDGRARRALLNRMRELRYGSQPYADGADVELKGEFAGMRLKQAVVPLELVDQNKTIVDGLYEVNLEVSWPGGGNTRASKQLKFYANPAAGF
jgi:type II secretory pathway pseudopilin PulG